ncbi:MAG: tyrosine-type recombinase/integrase [Xanthobacteraceae bacterium]
MAGSIRYVRGLENRSSRMKIKPGPRVYWRAIIGALALGYQRRRAGAAGRWIARSYIGAEKYRQMPLGMADDYEQSNGGTILTFEEASEKVRQSHRTGQDRPLSILTVADAIVDYVAWLKVHKATGRGSGQAATRHILPDLGKIRLSDLTTRQLTDWRDELAEQPALVRSRPGAPQNYRRAPTTPEHRRARRATVNRIWTVLRAALNKAFVDGHVASDVAWRRVKPFSQTSAARPGFLTAAEATRLVNASNPDFRLLVRGALETGARYGELAAAHVRDFQNSKLHIARSKSGRDRNVVLSDDGAAFFTSITVGRPDEPIFLRNGRPWRKSEQAKPMKTACQNGRIAPAISFNALRHTWASLAVMGGMPLMVVARNLGHTDTRMVERHYGHLREDYVDKAVREHAPRYEFEPLSEKVQPIR